MLENALLFHEHDLDVHSATTKITMAACEKGWISYNAFSELWMWQVHQSVRVQLLLQINWKLLKLIQRISKMYSITVLLVCSEKREYALILTNTFILMLKMTTNWWQSTEDVVQKANRTSLSFLFFIFNYVHPFRRATTKVLQYYLIWVSHQ